MSFCRHCGAEASSSAKFCRQCGLAIGKIETGAKAAPKRARSTQETHRLEEARRGAARTGSPSLVSALAKNLALTALVLGPGFFLLATEAVLAGSLWLFAGSFGLMAWTYRRPWKLTWVSCLLPVLAAVTCYLLQFVLFARAAPAPEMWIVAAIAGGIVGYLRASAHKVYVENCAVYAQRSILFLLIWAIAYGATQILGLVGSHVFAIRGGLLAGAFSTAMLSVVSVALIVSSARLRREVAATRRSFAWLLIAPALGMAALLSVETSLRAEDQNLTSVQLAHLDPQPHQHDPTFRHCSPRGLDLCFCFNDYGQGVYKRGRECGDGAGSLIQPRRRGSFTVDPEEAAVVAAISAIIMSLAGLMVNTGQVVGEALSGASGTHGEGASSPRSTLIDPFDNQPLETNEQGQYWLAWERKWGTRAEAERYVQELKRAHVDQRTARNAERDDFARETERRKAEMREKARHEREEVENRKAAEEAQKKKRDHLFKHIWDNAADLFRADRVLNTLRSAFDRGEDIQRLRRSGMEATFGAEHAEAEQDAADASVAESAATEIRDASMRFNRIATLGGGNPLVVMAQGMSQGVAEGYAEGGYQGAISSAAATGVDAATFGLGTAIREEWDPKAGDGEEQPGLLRRVANRWWGEVRDNLDPTVIAQRGLDAFRRGDLGGVLDAMLDMGDARDDWKHLGGSRPDSSDNTRGVSEEGAARAREQTTDTSPQREGGAQAQHSDNPGGYLDPGGMLSDSRDALASGMETPPSVRNEPVDAGSLDRTTLDEFVNSRLDITDAPRASDGDTSSPRDADAGQRPDRDGEHGGDGADLSDLSDASSRDGGDAESPISHDADALDERRTPPEIDSPDQDAALRNPDAQATTRNQDNLENGPDIGSFDHQNANAERTDLLSPEMREQFKRFDSIRLGRRGIDGALAQLNTLRDAGDIPPSAYALMVAELHDRDLTRQIGRVDPQAADGVLARLSEAEAQGWVTPERANELRANLEARQQGRPVIEDPTNYDRVRDLRTFHDPQYDPIQRPQVEPMDCGNAVSEALRPDLTDAAVGRRLEPFRTRNPDGTLGGINPSRMEAALNSLYQDDPNFNPERLVEQTNSSAHTDPADTVRRMQEIMANDPDARFFVELEHQNFVDGATRTGRHAAMVTHIYPDGTLRIYEPTYVAPIRGTLAELAAAGVNIRFDHSFVVRQVDKDGGGSEA